MRDIDIAILSVRPSVCLSVRPSSIAFRYSMETSMIVSK